MTRQELIQNIRSKQSFLCVGLDPDPARMPARFAGNPDGLFDFCKEIADATADTCIAYKPNAAFFECQGLKGWEAFNKLACYIKERYPSHFLIADAKRGDIGNTSKMYAQAFFDRMPFDAVTIAPYMGTDSITPFLSYPGKWVILLDLTSNAGSLDFQMIPDEKGERLFEKVLRKSLEWGNEDNMMFVAGATRGSLLSDIRSIVPNHFLLVPGVGAQGGSLKEVVEYGMNSDCGLLVNNSRKILYASNGADFAEAAGKEAFAMQQEMAGHLKMLF